MDTLPLGLMPASSRRFFGMVICPFSETRIIHLSLQDFPYLFQPIEQVKNMASAPRSAGAYLHHPRSRALPVVRMADGDGERVGGIVRIEAGARHQHAHHHVNLLL